MFSQTTPQNTITAALKQLTLEQLAGAPEVRALVEREAAKVVEQRRELVKSLQALDTKEFHDKQVAAQAKINRVEARIAEAKAALAAAFSEHLAATGEAMAVSAPVEHARHKLLRQLRESADPRIAKFIDKVNELYYGDRTRFLAATSPVSEKNYVTGGKNIRYVSNVDDVTEVRQEFLDAKHYAEQLQLEALSGDEVRERLTAWCDRLNPRLRSFNLVGLQVTDVDVIEG
jgi:hypothetical protein